MDEMIERPKSSFRQKRVYFTPKIQYKSINIEEEEDIDK